jgi:hypothetical protein
MAWRVLPGMPSEEYNDSLDVNGMALRQYYEALACPRKVTQFVSDRQRLRSLFDRPPFGRKSALGPKTSSLS